MFESSLLALDQKKTRGKRWLSVPLAIVLHLVVLVSLTFAQYWNVDQITEPPVNAVFVSFSSPPPPPIARGSRAPQPTAAPAHPAAPTPTRTLTQPPPVIPDTPPVPTTPQTEDITSSTSPSNLPAGPTTGDPNGVPNGDPNGVLNGTGPVGTIGIGVGTVDDPPIAVSGAVTRPVIIDRVEPQYTEMARRARLEGTVIVQATIDTSGQVIDIKVLKRLPMGLDQAAIDAVSRWRFKPATLYGRAVKVFYSLTVNFRVQ
jgi:protein TonB